MAYRSPMLHICICYYTCMVFAVINLYGVTINKISDDLLLSWEPNPGKYVSVYHSKTLDGAFFPVDDFYKIPNLNNFAYSLDNECGFFKIVESDSGAALNDFSELMDNGDSFNMIPGARIRVEQVTTSNSSFFNLSFLDYYDIILINESEFFQIENDGDFIFGNYSIVLENDLSGVVNFTNAKAYFKPGSRTEFPDDASHTLIFNSGSPLNITQSYPDPDPRYSDTWTVNEAISFFFPSGKMPNDLLNKTIKVYSFNESSDYAGYVELNFDSHNTGSILLASGNTPITYSFNQLTHSSASITMNFSIVVPDLSTGGSTNTEYNLAVAATFFSKDEQSGYFKGTTTYDGNTSDIYGYYGETSIPVDHFYGYSMDNIFILNDQNSDGLVTQEDAEIFMANNPNVIWLYPSITSLPSYTSHEDEDEEHEEDENH